MWNTPKIGGLTWAMWVLGLVKGRSTLLQNLMQDYKASQLLSDKLQFKLKHLLDAIVQSSKTPNQWEVIFQYYSEHRTVSIEKVLREDDLCSFFLLSILFLRETRMEILLAVTFGLTWADRDKTTHVSSKGWRGWVSMLCVSVPLCVCGNQVSSLNHTKTNCVS